MSAGTVESPTKERIIVVAPFGIEADHPRCCDLLIKSIPNCRLRSVIDGSRPARDFKSGEMKVPRDQAISMGDFPRTPGMQLHVNPLELTYLVVDPLKKDEATQGRIVSWMKQHKGLRADKIKIEEHATGKLDIHEMKTLCRELYDIVDSGEAKQIKGSKLTMEEIDQLPGHYMLNPGLRTMTTQPRFEKDFEAWVSNLANVGG